MADRTVKVSLVAQVNGYIDGMNRAAAATRNMSNDAQAKLAAQRAAFEGVGRAALAVGVLAVAGVAIAIKKYAEFDQAMSKVAAVTQETTENMEALRAAALDAGGRTVYTATEAANAIVELGKAGLTTADILGGALEGALSLAATEQMDVARAAEITATTLKQYGLAGTDAARVADVLAAAAGKALGSAEDLAQGLKFVGPVAASMGVSLEETAGALALFADQGLIGEQAGTSLRGVLASLTSPSKQAADEIKRLNIDLYDAQGGFIGLEGTAAQLAEAYRGLDDQSRDASLGIIFGNAQVTAARVLFAAGGEEVRKYTEQVNDAGYAARVAADRLNNLSGDVEKLGGAIDTALIQSGSGANDVLRTLTQTATFLVDGIGGIPAPVLGVGLALGTLTAAIALSVAAAGLAIPRYAALKLAMQDLSLSGRRVAAGVGLAGGAIGAALVVLGLFAQQAQESKAATDAFAESLDKSSGAATRYTRDLAAKRLADIGAFDLAEKAGVSQQQLTDALIAGGDAWDEVSAKVSHYGLTVDTVANQPTVVELQRVGEELANSRKQWEDTTAATENSTAADRQKSDALAQIAGAAGLATDEVSALADQIRGFADLTLSTRDAERQFQEAIDAATEAVQRNGASLNIGTDAGRANEESLDAIAKAAKEVAAAKYEQTGSEAAAADAIQAGRDALIAQLGLLQITGQAAEDYADELGLIPANVSTVVALNTSQAERDLASFIRLASGRTVRVNATVVNGPGFASGGYTGSGSKYQPAGIVHAGEYVIRRERVQAVGLAYLDRLNAGGLPGYANGGQVAAAAGSVTYVFQVTVPVSGSMVGDYDFMAQKIGEAVQVGLGNGALQSNWYKRD